MRLNRYDALGRPLGLVFPTAAVASVQLAALMLALLIPAPTSDAGLLVTEEGEEGKQMLCADGETARICLPSDYMKFELPEDHEANVVSIGVDIKDIPKVNDKDFSITLNAYFIVKWRDARLMVSDRNRTSKSSSRPPAQAAVVMEGAGGGRRTSSMTSTTTTTTTGQIVQFNG